MSDKPSEHLIDKAATEQPPASAEAPLAAEAASSAATPTDADAATDTGGDDESKRKPPRSRSRAHKPARTASKARTHRAAPADEPRGLAERLLAPLSLPRIALDRRLLPQPLLKALDDAGLGGADSLPSATFLTLSAIGAVAGPTLRCEPVDDVPPGTADDGLSLRVALLTADHRSSPVPAPILAAAYAVENDLLDTYHDAVSQVAEQRRAAEQRRRLYEQAARTAATLGIAPPPPLPEAVPVPLGPRPRIVVGDGAASAVRAAAAGGTGVWLIDEQRMPSMANVADFYDEATESLLSTAAAGHQIPIADPNSGRVTMRAFPASVVGCLRVADCATLDHAGPPQLAGTVFVPAAAAPAVGDSTALVALMRRVRSISENVTKLRLPAQADALVTAAAAWAALAAGTQPPLSDFWAGLPDLARRLAALLHLAAAGGDGQPTPVIPPATLKRALAVIDGCVVPTARALLGPISSGEVERDARRLIQHLGTITSPQNRVFERRPLMRAWQHSMRTRRFDAALALLQEAGLLVALDKIDGKGGGGQRFEVAASVYATA